MYVAETPNAEHIVAFAREGMPVRYLKQPVVVHTPSGAHPAVRLDYWVDVLGPTPVTWSYSEHRIADAGGMVNLRDTLLDRLTQLQATDPNVRVFATHRTGSL